MSRLSPNRELAAREAKWSLLCFAGYYVLALTNLGVPADGSDLLVEVSLAIDVVAGLLGWRACWRYAASVGRKPLVYALIGLAIPPLGLLFAYYEEPINRNRPVPWWASRNYHLGSGLAHRFLGWVKEATGKDAVAYRRRCQFGVSIGAINLSGFWQATFHHRNQPLGELEIGVIGWLVAGSVVALAVAWWSAGILAQKQQPDSKGANPMRTLLGPFNFLIHR